MIKREKPADESSLVYTNIEKCTLNFINGKSVFINVDGKNRFLVVNITVR